jgi:hypothetical protein
MATHIFYILIADLQIGNPGSFTVVKADCSPLTLADETAAKFYPESHRPAIESAEDTRRFRHKGKDTPCVSTKSWTLTSLQLLVAR